MSAPDRALADPTQLLLAFLDSYREGVARKLAGAPEDALRVSRLPSGWTPLGLLKHLVYMERRWLVWGFLAEPVPDPWADDGPDGRWHDSPQETLEGLLAAMRAGGDRTRSIAEAAALSTVGKVGGRFGPDEPPPTLGWILHHVLEEYTRHLGHLDVARELLDGAVGE